MFTAKSGKRRLGVYILFALAVLALVVSSLAEALPTEEPERQVRMPEASGDQVQKDGNLYVDSSHSADGYIMVKLNKASKKRQKVRVSVGGSNLNYDLNSDGDFEVFPLQFGRVNYTVSLYQNVEGKKYKEAGKLTVSPKGMEDELSCFLYPNQYVNYTEETECVQVAVDLCKDMTDQSEIYKAICKYIVSNFSYDFIKSVTVQPGKLPDIDDCWAKKMGICQDLSAVTCAMLRSQGVPARLMIGTLGSGTPHAWVLAVVDGEDKFFDPTAELNATNKTETYTTERWY